MRMQRKRRMQVVPGTSDSGAEPSGSGAERQAADLAGPARGLSRRAFVRGALGAAGAFAIGRVPLARALGTAGVAYPFTLGIASGDPTYFGVTLWTRLAPDPLHPAGTGGMPPVPVEVAYEVGLDPQLRRVVKRGRVLAQPANAHAVRVPVAGLPPDRWYWYRFTTGGIESPIGRTRTFPLPNAATARMRFAFVSCQDYQNGYYTAYRALSEEDLDFVVHLGDYIYEGGVRSTAVRPHDGPEIRTLAQYRNRHALYKLDSELQAAHAAFPFVAVFDDHEVENNYAGEFDENGTPPSEFLLRRANAYQAYAEHLPFAPSVQASGPNLTLYRRFRFGDLASISLLDTRQFRSGPICGGDIGACPDRLSDERTMMGHAQEAWLLEGLARSKARWNVIGQQTVMAQINFLAIAPPSEIYNLDQWDGYPAGRERILNFLADARVANPVVLTGDIHSSWVWDLPATYTTPLAPLVATEFVGTSVTSNFPPELTALAPVAGQANRGFRYFDGGRHGYVRCTVDPQGWRSDYRVVSTIASPVATVSTAASFQVEDGQPGALPA